MNEEETTSGEQGNIKEKRIEQIKPWMYKKGQSGNPSGRPKGISLKEYAKMKFAHMTEDEREEYFNGIDKKDIWEMGEGKAQSNTDLTSGGEKITLNLINYGEKKTE